RTQQERLPDDGHGLLSRYALDAHDAEIAVVAAKFEPELDRGRIGCHCRVAPAWKGINVTTNSGLTPPRKRRNLSFDMRNSHLGIRNTGNSTAASAKHCSTKSSVSPMSALCSRPSRSARVSRDRARGVLPQAPCLGPSPGFRLGPPDAGSE